MRPLRRLLLPCIAVAVLAGCGLRFTYGQLDWLIPWYLRDYVTLQPAQRSELDRRLAGLLDWHCRAHLPDYARLLRDLGLAVQAGPVSAATLDAFVRRGEELWDELMRTLTPEAAALFASLDDVQRAELAAAFERRNAETREEFLEGSAAALRERRIERMEKRLRRWFGPLDEPQRARIAQWNDALAPTGEDWLAQRIAWQQSLLGALDARSAPAAFERELEGLLRTPEQRWPADYRARVAHNRTQTLALLADLANGASARQRAHLLEELAGMAADFERLACQEAAVRAGALGRMDTARGVPDGRLHPAGLRAAV